MIEGESSPIRPEIPGMGKIPEEKGGPSGGSIEKALHTKVKTLGQLKQVLIDNLGKKEGEKVYNYFMGSIAMEMLSQIQHAAQQAKKASQQMRANNQG